LISPTLDQFYGLDVRQLLDQVGCFLGRQRGQDARLLLVRQAREDQRHLAVGQGVQKLPQWGSGTGLGEFRKLLPRVLFFRRHV
jgi:hypothetical protein